MTRKTDSLMERVLPSSDRIKPVAIDSQRKWEYFMSVGAPGNLTVEESSFDEVVGRYGKTSPFGLELRGCLELFTEAILALFLAHFSPETRRIVVLCNEFQVKNGPKRT